MKATMRKSKKEQVVERATELFFEKGILATSMDEIAAAVPVSKMTIYNYYQSKDRLVSEVLDRYIRYLHDVMSEMIAAHPTDPLQALLATLDYRQFRIPELFLRECLEHYPQFTAQMITYYNVHVAGQFEQLILSAQQKGQIRKEISPHLLLLYVQGIKDFLSRPEIMHGIQDLKAASEQFRTMFLYGIVAPEHQQTRPPKED